MRYLYGDSTPFPLNENFLDTLCAATDASVALISADSAAHEARRAVEDADESVAKELARLDALGASIERSALMHGAAEAPSSVTEAAATRIGQLAHETLEEARAGVLRWREATVAAAHATVPDALAVLAAFLVRHQLPETAWSFEWRAGMRGAPPRAHVHAAAPCGINASFEVAVPPKHLWAEALRASSLQRKTVIKMLRKALFRGVAMRDEALHRLYVTEVVYTAERSTLLLSKSPKRLHPGIEVTLPRRDASGPAGAVTVARLDARGARTAEPAVLSAQDAALVVALWDRVLATIADLVCYRKRMVFAALHGTALQQLPTPASVSKTLVDALAPIVREIRRRSRTPGELAIKRDLGDGRREEHFVAHGEIERRYAHLSRPQRAVFDAFGLNERPSLAVVHALPRPSHPPVRAASGTRPTPPASQRRSIPPEEPDQQTLKLRVLELSEGDVISA